MQNGQVKNNGAIEQINGREGETSTFLSNIFVVFRPTSSQAFGATPILASSYMKYIFTLTLLILLSSLSRAEQIYFIPQPIPKPTTPITVDEYSEISSKEEKERLKLAAEQIKEYQNQVEDMQVPIIFYGEKCSALKRASRVRDYLVKTEGIESERIRTIYGGDNKVWRVVIYLLPVKVIKTESNLDSSNEKDCQAKQKKPKRPVKRHTHRTKQ